MSLKIRKMLFFLLISFSMFSVLTSISYGGNDGLEISEGVAYGKNSKKLPWFMVEYRSSAKLFWFRPWLGLGGTDKDVLGALGLSYEFNLSKIKIRLSFGAGKYHGNRDGLELGYGLEFISSGEILYKLPKSIYVGIRASHISNAGLGEENPGTNIFSLQIVLPIKN